MAEYELYRYFLERSRIILHAIMYLSSYINM